MKKCQSWNYNSWNNVSNVAYNSKKWIDLPADQFQLIQNPQQLFQWYNWLYRQLFLGLEEKVVFQQELRYPAAFDS